jgi:hypothetical protein
MKYLDYFNYYNSKNNKDQYHMKIIDYILLLKLIMNNKGYDFTNNFYEYMASYLYPTIKPFSGNEYNDINYYKYIVCKYNINDNLFNYKLKNNFYISITMKNRINFENIKVLYFNINIIKKYFFNINIINFNLLFPLESIIFIKNYEWNYDDFNNFIENLWIKSKTLENNDYIYCDDDKRKLYYELFKKVILRILKMQTN